MARYGLAGKNVFITGGGRGLGATTACILADRGARVALADVDLAAAQGVANTLPAGRALALQCDVTDLKSVRTAVERTQAELGRIDVTIANAGILGRAGTFRSLLPEQIASVIAVNVGGVVNTISATVESVIANKGQVVLMSSVFAYLNGAGAIPYAMSKAAVEQLGRGLAVELAGHGASAMTAYFSLIDTDMIRNGIDGDPHALALLAELPDFVSTKVTPQVAATAIVDGLERRRRSVTVPGRWRPVSALRGVAGPLGDAALARHPGIRRALADLDGHH